MREEDIDDYLDSLTPAQRRKEMDRLFAKKKFPWEWAIVLVLWAIGYGYLSGAIAILILVRREMCKHSKS